MSLPGGIAGGGWWGAAISLLRAFQHDRAIGQSAVGSQPPGPRRRRTKRPERRRCDAPSLPPTRVPVTLLNGWAIARNADHVHNRRADRVMCGSRGSVLRTRDARIMPRAATSLPKHPPAPSHVMRRSLTRSLLCNTGSYRRSLGTGTPLVLDGYREIRASSSPPQGRGTGSVCVTFAYPCGSRIDPSLSALTRSPELPVVSFGNPLGSGPPRHRFGGGNGGKFPADRYGDDGVSVTASLGSVDGTPRQRRDQINRRRVDVCSRGRMVEAPRRGDSDGRRPHYSGWGIYESQHRVYALTEIHLHLGVAQIAAK